MGYTKFNEGWNTNKPKGQDGNQWVHMAWFISLDNLVPVWTKLNLPKILEMDIRCNNYASGFGFRTYAELSYDSYVDSSESIQEAAAIATANTILSLKGEKHYEI